jgi:transposase
LEGGIRNRAVKQYLAGCLPYGEAYADIAGVRQKVQVFVMHLCYSRRTYAACFPSQNQESFLWAHVAAFRHFGGVPHRISYDNLATAVKLVFDKTSKRKRQRQEAGAFASFRSYYLFESHFCTPAKGNEKGGVEGSVLCRHFCDSLYFTLLLPVHQGAHVSQLKAARSV